MASNLTFFRADEIAAGSTITADVDVPAGMPLSNLKTPQLGYVARLLGTTAEVTIDFGRIRPISAVAALGHSLTTAGEWRVRGDTDPGFAAPPLDTGMVKIWPQTVGWGQQSWGAFPWGLRSATPGGDKGFAFFPAVGIRYLKVAFSDPSNPAEVMDIGRLWAEAVFQPSRSAGNGYGLRFVDGSTVTMSRDGTPWKDRRPKRSEMELQVDFLTEAEAYGFVLRMQRDLGVADELIAMIERDNLAQRHFNTLYGRLSDTPLVRYTGRQSNGKRFAAVFPLEGYSS